MRVTVELRGRLLGGAAVDVMRIVAGFDRRIENGTGTTILYKSLAVCAVQEFATIGGMS